MASSLGLRALIERHLAGLTDSPSKAAQVRATALMYLPSILATAAVAVFRLDLSGAASALIAGFSLIAGVLIAVFTQMASWRDRLAERAETYWLTDAPARRAVDAAASHALVGVGASVVAVALAILLEADVRGVTVWSAGLAGACVWVLSLLILIVRSAAISYESTANPDIRRQDRDLRSPTFVEPKDSEPSSATTT